MKKERKRFVTKNKILTILKEKPYTAKEISRKTFIGHSTIIEHLNNMKNKGKVEIIGKGKYNSNIWCIKNVNTNND